MKNLKLISFAVVIFCFLISCSSKQNKFKQPKVDNEKSVDIHEVTKNIYDGSFGGEIKTVTIQVFYSDSYDETIVLHGGNLFYMIDDNTGANYIIDRTNSRSKDDYDVIFKTTASIKIVSYQ
jgi:hypothetical protein